MTGTCISETAEILATRAPVHRAAIRPRDCDAESGAAGQQHRGGARLSRAHHGRAPAGCRFEPLMTCYLTDATDPEEVARGFEEEVFTAVKLYPAQATTNSAFGVTDYRPGHAGARTHGRARHAVVDPRRGNRPGGRRVRPRSRVYRPGARPAAAPTAGTARCARAHHDRRGGRLRDLGRAEPGGDDHRASPYDQSQRDLCRRHPAASLLPADRQTREASAGFAPGRDLGRPQVLSRHRQRAARRFRPKRRRAAAPASSPRRARSRFIPRSSRRKRRSTGSKPSLR